MKDNLLIFAGQNGILTRRFPTEQERTIYKIKKDLDSFDFDLDIDSTAMNEAFAQERASKEGFRPLLTVKPKAYKVKLNSNPGGYKIYKDGNLIRTVSTHTGKYDNDYKNMEERTGYVKEI